MRACYIVSVGTSIFRRWKEFKQQNSLTVDIETEIYKWDTDSHTIEDEHPSEIIRAFISYIQKMAPDAQKEISAEIDTLMSIQPAIPTNSPLYLLSSDTDTGYAAAVLNQQILAALWHFKEVKTERIAGMQLKSEMLNSKGIPELLHRISKIKNETHERSSSMPCVLIVSGGWKPLSILMAFSGMFLEIPVYYAHEDESPIQLPHIPIQYEPNLFNDIDIRILNTLYLKKKLPKEFGLRLKRQIAINKDSIASFFKETGDTDSPYCLNEFGRLALASYLGGKQDYLTGLFNKESFEKTALRILPDKKQRLKERNSGTNHCFAFGDMDNLKALNTKYGHSKVDKIIKKVAEALKKGIETEPGSLCARRSGDEFWILFETESFENAQNVLDKVCSFVKLIKLNGIKTSPSITIAGVFIPSSKQDYSWKDCEKFMEDLHKEMKASKERKGSAEIHTMIPLKDV